MLEEAKEGAAPFGTLAPSKDTLVLHVVSGPPVSAAVASTQKWYSLNL